MTNILRVVRRHTRCAGTRREAADGELVVLANGEV